MTKVMSDEELQRTADFYGISLEEGRRLNQIMVDQGDNPDDPICVGCAKRPHELDEYVDAAEGELEDIHDEPTNDEIKQYVIDEEGTYNDSNGHFLCTMCYIKNGQPSKPFPNRWVCP